MTRCLFCRRRVWPWQRIGWVIGRGQWHPDCLFAAVTGEAARRPLTGTDIQRILDEAQQ